MKRVFAIDLSICCLIAVFSSNQAKSAESVYGPGKLNIQCRCLHYNVEKWKWHHIVEIPHESFTVDLNSVCKVTRNNYPNGPDVQCKDSYEYVGKEYSFDPY